MSQVEFLTASLDTTLHGVYVLSVPVSVREQMHHYVSLSLYQSHNVIIRIILSDLESYTPGYFRLTLRLQSHIF